MSYDEKNYLATLRLLNQITAAITQQRISLKDLGLSDDQIEKAMQPTLSFQEQLNEDLDLIKASLSAEPPDETR